MLKRIIAEVLGTFVLVFVGTTTAVLTGGNLLATALAFGLSLTAMIYALGGVSGGHFNPAVSIAQWLTKKISLVEFGFYAAAQLVGAVLGTLLLWVFTDFQTVSLGANQLAPMFVAADLGLLVGLLTEIVLTFIFVLVILSVTKDEEKAPIAGLVIGLVLTMSVIAGFMITGGSLNPVRSLAPALFQGGAAFEQVWFYIVGPLVGGALAGVVANYLHADE
ncbi:MAG: aquaporin [Acholeplasmataceae bacterium]|nr:aquaporin [Acholeplasmataceae bacterium]